MSPDLEDADLVARALDGDDHAFTQLMRRHKQGLYRFVRRYVGEADASLDVVQESFVAAWRALARFDGRRPFGVWLRAIALNKCRDRSRRLAVRRLALGEKDPDSAEAQRRSDPAPDAEASLIDRQRIAALDAALSKLPANLKEPLLLTYFEELSHEQTAALLGISAKAVEMRAYRARQRLAELLAPDRKR